MWSGVFYAVNELYERLQDEILNQKAHYVERQSKISFESLTKQQERKLVKGIIIALAFFFLIGFLLSLDKYRDGYYHYGNAHYYNSNDNWYYYDDTSEYWFPASSVPDGLKQNADKYFYSEY